MNVKSAAFWLPLTLVVGAVLVIVVFSVIGTSPSNTQSPTAEGPTPKTFAKTIEHSLAHPDEPVRVEMEIRYLFGPEGSSPRRFESKKMVIDLPRELLDEESEEYSTCLCDEPTDLEEVFSIECVLTNEMESVTVEVPPKTPFENEMTLSVAGSLTWKYGVMADKQDPPSYYMTIGGLVAEKIQTSQELPLRQAVDTWLKKDLTLEMKKYVKDCQEAYKEEDPLALKYLAEDFQKQVEASKGTLK
ncbi:MAG: hypothetical protein PVH19_11200 [Planctomycetia bacterium]